MEVMILDNDFSSNNDLVTAGPVKTLKRTLSAPGEDVCRKRCRCENCREEFFQQRAERRAEIAVRKAERLAVRVEKLAAKIEREAAKAERKAGKADKKEKKEKREKTKRGKKASKTEGMDLDIALQKKEGGQTHELSKQFLQLAPEAYAPNVREMILSKAYSKIVIDGNNMMFITNGLRKNTLHGKRKQSEKLLSLAALAFSQLVGVTTEVIFDATHLPKKRDDSILDGASVPSVEKSSVPAFTTEIAKIAKDFPVVGVPITFTDGTFVLVSSARPEFATTDDKLISWARANKQELSLSGPRNSDVVVVSSDRALAGELYSLGVTLIKPGNWIGLLASLLGFEEQSSQKGELFKWFDSYCTSLSSD
jgi:hypothetical protein